MGLAFGRFVFVGFGGGGDLRDLRGLRFRGSRGLRGATLPQRLTGCVDQAAAGNLPASGAAYAAF